MNSTDQEIHALLAELTGNTERLNTISNYETISSSSHVLLEVLKIVKDMSQRDGITTKLNYDPPGVVLFNQLRIDTDNEMVQFSYVFALLSVLTVIMDKLVGRARKVCHRVSSFPCVSVMFAFSESDCTF